MRQDDAEISGTVEFPFRYIKGRFQWVNEEFQLPMKTMVNVWVHYCMLDFVGKPPPLADLNAGDVSHLPRGWGNLCDIKLMSKMIKAEVQIKGLWSELIDQKKAHEI